MSAQAFGYTVFTAIVGIALICYGLYLRVRARASERWLPAVGKITEASLVLEQSGESQQYNVQVLYEFVADGRRYSSKRLEFGHSTYLSKKNAQAMLDRFPLNTTVVVYFNPEKPEDAVLVRGSSYSVAYLLAGLLVLGYSLAVLFLSYAKK